MQPIPCANCGRNFMRKTPTTKLCNSCEKKPIVDENKIKILIECDKKNHGEIEEKCVNEGITFSQYFMSLHNEYKKNIEEIPETILPKKRVKNEKN